MERPLESVPRGRLAAMLELGPLGGGREPVNLGVHAARPCFRRWGRGARRGSIRRRRPEAAGRESRSPARALDGGEPHAEASSSGCGGRGRRSSSRRIARVRAVGGPARCRPARQQRARPQARRAAWFAAGPRAGPHLVGTRSALLAPLPSARDAGPARRARSRPQAARSPALHSRDLLRQRAAIEGSRLLLLSATPSVRAGGAPTTEQESIAASDLGERVASVFTGRHARHPAEPSLSPCRSRGALGSRRAPAAATRSSSSRGAPGHFICPSAAPSCAAATARSRSRYLREDANPLSAPVREEQSRYPERYSATAAGIVSRRSAGIADAWRPAVARRFPKLTISRTDPRAQIVHRHRRRCWRTSRPASSDAVGIVALDEHAEPPTSAAASVPSSSRGRRPRPRGAGRPPRRADAPPPALRGSKR